MKSLLTYILLTMYILYGVGNIGIYISFKFNQDYIARVLCINKDAPEKKCNGKCHLNKELKKAEDKKQEQTPIIPEIKEQLQFFEPLFLSTIYSPEQPKTTYFIYQKCCSPNNFTSSIFHPPKELV